MDSYSFFMHNTRPTMRAATASVDSKPGSIIGVGGGVEVAGTGSVVNVITVVGCRVVNVV
jgi:hypothetical protein